MKQFLLNSIKCAGFLLMFFFSSAEQLNAQTNVPGLLTSNQDWTLSGSPYIINQNTYMDTGVRIRVYPGVEVRSTGGYKLDIRGEFQAIGKWDTIININNLHLNFLPESKGYSPSNGRGAYFKYCNFDGGSNLTTQMTLNSKSVKIDHCEFRSSYFTLYMMRSSTTDTTYTTITNSKFYGDGKGSGSPIRSNIWISRMVIENCDFMDGNYIYTYGNIQFRNNRLNRMYSFSSEYLFGYNEFSCNRFTNFKSEIALDISGIYTKGVINFHNNTLDSIGQTSYPYKMLNIKRPMSSYAPFGPVYINDNNFLQKIGPGAKLYISAVNQNPLKTDSIDCTNNYWGSSDTTVIKGFISDYSDDAGIYGRAIYAPYQSNAITGCSYNANCARPDFKFTVNDATVDFEDQSISSKTYKVRWNFGDGNQNTDNDKTVEHTYSNSGNYYACLYTYDSLDNLCDSLCKVIRIDEAKPCRADYYFAIDTLDVNSVYLVNNSKGVKQSTSYLWTFGDGSSSSLVKPVHTYISAGKYEICLNISETSSNCNDNHCDSFTVKAGNVLVVLNESDITGVSMHEKRKVVQVYPNPGAGVFTVSFVNESFGTAILEVYNLEGRLLFSENFEIQEGSVERTFDASALENGVYTVRVQTGNSNRTIQLIVNK